MIIAIDGTSGSGKSTIAKTLAKELNFGFFSAGALYRAITLKALQLKIDETSDEKLKLMLDSTLINYYYDGQKNVLKLDGIDVTNILHNEEISSNVAKYSCKPFVREYVRNLQRDTKNHNENIVMEGRDIGSVIFPDADFKVFVDCKVDTRARRRFNDLIKDDPTVKFEDILNNLKERDYKDIHREISPLIMSNNSVLIDTTGLSVERCIDILKNEMTDRNLLKRNEPQQ